MTTLLLALAGGAGAGMRFVVDGFIRSYIHSTLPVATMAINITGSFLLGLLAGAVLRQGIPADLRLVLGTGFLGGYTTFSTASVETVRLVQTRHAALALMNALGTLVAAAGAAAAGLALALR
ncbi:fluoride efflux transporter CrcB [Arthrobacter sp. I2-34]|uniref:Fluoride-specific ion channel FluC n=1 Tax=Arthrobacter hankyongi TaxID=2904801 RepID=A0ABS9L2V8_9MICC|nr:fluoride efflux transporter CrcB [Arthrobacter hankyongi]MCG2620913.1 fluoride efflux transporter CrcB [Arthrobacter hankyongi]